MITALMAGFVVGLVISAPLGPMAALAALRLGEGRVWASVMIAAGVCLADMILAIMAMGLLSLPFSFGIPESWLVAAAVLLLGGFGAVVWKGAGGEVRPREGMTGFGSALVVSLVHPGNIGAYLGLYASLLPAMGLGMVTEMEVSHKVLLLMATGVGMAAGWGLFLVAVQLLCRKYGLLPAHVRPWMARGAGGLMMGFAAGLAVWHLVG